MVVDFSGDIKSDFPVLLPTGARGNHLSASSGLRQEAALTAQRNILQRTGYRFIMVGTLI